MKSIFLVDSPKQLQEVYGNCDFQCHTDLQDLQIDHFVTKDELGQNPTAYQDVEYIFSTWYMPVLKQEEIEEYFPALKAVFYAAGTCKYFAEPYLNLGVRVFSARTANGIPVAEFTAAQIILANKGYFRAQTYYKGYRFRKGRAYSENHVGNYRSKVGIIGAGAVGAGVIKLLKPYELQIYVYDPFLTQERVTELNVIRVEKIQDLFETCDVISNHLPDNPDTFHMLDGSCFSKMKKNASFINTGRGRQVAERDLISVLKKRPDVSAILDVSRYEPSLFISPLYRLKNVFLSPHIAGSLGQEKWRMAEEMLDAYEAVRTGKVVACEITIDMLKNMA